MLQNSYLDEDLRIGEVIYLDTSSREAVAKGYGQISLSKLRLTAHVQVVTPGIFNKILIILRTHDEFIAPFVLYRETLLAETKTSVSYDIRAYLLWSASQDIAYPLEKFRSLDITIQALHTPDSLQSEVYPRGTTERLMRHALSTKLSSADYCDISVDCSSGYITSRQGVQTRRKSHSQLDTFIRYRFLYRNRPFSFGDIGKILLAFKLYWIDNFDYVDCNIKSIKLGNELFLYLANSQLFSVSTTSPDYRSTPLLSRKLHVETLAKMTHFFLNPKNSKKLGGSSKIGLAFVRLIDYRFGNHSEVFYMNITSLIFALQSFAEAVAEGEIRYMNRKERQLKYESITQVLEAIKNINGLHEDVQKFYLRSDREVYKLMTRPTFMRSLEIAFNKLRIDMTEYKSMLRTIDAARRQVVHSEGYDADFLLSLLTDTVTQLDIGAKNNNIVSIVHKDSEVDKLYKLIRLMTHRYFENFKH